MKNGPPYGRLTNPTQPPFFPAQPTSFIPFSPPPLPPPPSPLPPQYTRAGLVTFPPGSGTCLYPRTPVYFPLFYIFPNKVTKETQKNAPFFPPPLSPFYTHTHTHTHTPLPHFLTGLIIPSRIAFIFFFRLISLTFCSSFTFLPPPPKLPSTLPFAPPTHHHLTHPLLFAGLSFLNCGLKIALILSLSVNTTQHYTTTPGYSLKENTAPTTPPLPLPMTTLLLTAAKGKKGGEGKIQAFVWFLPLY